MHSSYDKIKPPAKQMSEWRLERTPFVYKACFLLSRSCKRRLEIDPHLMLSILSGGNWLLSFT